VVPTLAVLRDLPGFVVQASNRSAEADPTRDLEVQRTSAEQDENRIAFIRVHQCLSVVPNLFREESGVIRKAFVMSVNPGQEAEYERRHRPIWKELEDALKSHGVHNYSIFLDPKSRQLFGYAEIEDEARWNAIAETAICKKWWAFMKDMMPSNPDNSPVAADLREVFHMD
jgi:L-rhamnose mutarotase